MGGTADETCARAVLIALLSVLLTRWACPTPVCTRAWPVNTAVSPRSNACTSRTCRPLAILKRRRQRRDTSPMRQGHDLTAGRRVKVHITVDHTGLDNSPGHIPVQNRCRR